MSWTSDDLENARRFTLAMAELLKNADVKIRTTAELDKKAINLVVECAQQRLTLKETTKQFVEFLQHHQMITGNIPKDVTEGIEAAFGRVPPSPTRHIRKERER